MYFVDWGVRCQRHQRSYLSNRKQYVSVKNSSSSMHVKHYIRCSACSVLFQYFLLLYVNDMHIDLQTRCVLFIFSDYATVFASDSDIDNIHATVNREVVGVDNWLKTNRLSLNVSKTSYMITSIQKIALDIKIRESILTKVLTVKFLGVTLDENLTFKDHVNKVTSKISKSICVMRRLHCQLRANVMVKLYYSLVYSHLTYALLAWGRSGSTNAAKIECAHRRACKLLADYSHRILTFHSIDYFSLLRLSTWIPLIFINISMTNYLLINRLIFTTTDTEQIVINY